MRTAAIAFLWLCSGVPLAAGDNTVRVPWSDLATHVSGKKISTVPADGKQVKGRVVLVQPEALAVQAAKERISLPRQSLSSIRVQRTGWKWKVILPVVGFFGLGALGAAIGNHIDPYGFIISDGAAYGALSGMATGLTAGILIGRRADRHYTVIAIAP